MSVNLNETRNAMPALPVASEMADQDLEVVAAGMLKSPGGIGGPASGLGVRPGLGFGAPGLGLRRGIG